MIEDVSQRARQRAEMARERAREAGVRAAELAARDHIDSDAARMRSQEALDRARFLAKEGYRNAAAAERAAARAHETVAGSIDKRAERSPAESEELHAKARKHREDALEHLRGAAIDEERLAELEQDE